MRISDWSSDVCSSDLELAAQVDREEKRLEVSPARRVKIEALVESYVAGAQSIDREPEVRLAMARILMARYANRISSMQASLFEDFDPDPKTPLKADAAIAEAARVHLYAGRSEEHTSEL